MASLSTPLLKLNSVELKYEQANRKMQRVAAELKSEYAQFSLHNDKDLTKYLSPNGQGPKGEPLFLPSLHEESQIIPDYVYSANGPNGAGYYSLLTKAAYTEIFGRLQRNPPKKTGILSRNPELKQEYEAWKWTLQLVHTRWEASRPNIQIPMWFSPDINTDDQTMFDEVSMADERMPKAVLA